MGDLPERLRAHSRYTGSMRGEEHRKGRCARPHILADCLVARGSATHRFTAGRCAFRHTVRRSHHCGDASFRLDQVLPFVLQLHQITILHAASAAPVAGPRWNSIQLPPRGVSEFARSCVATVATAALLWTLVERPAMALKARLVAGGRTRDRDLMRSTFAVLRPAGSVSAASLTAAPATESPSQSWPTAAQAVPARGHRR